jgi:O-antigen/teichoic acid export membrane protein
MKSFGYVWLRRICAPQRWLMDEARGRSRANACYGMADYLVLPIGMLLAAPLLLAHLGPAQYGVWALAGAAVNGGGIVSTGFGDAAIKYVGDCRGRGDVPGVVRIVRNMIAINLALSGSLAIALWCFAPYVTGHIVKIDRQLQTICVESLRIGGGLLVVRSLESVFISSLRAFEIYGTTVRISICSRILILIFTVALAQYGRTVVGIMIATVVVSISGTLAQALAVRRKIGNFPLMPSWQRKTLSEIFGYGSFSWLQAMSGVVFSHADRFFVGFFMGAPAVAYYSLCVQAAQPIHGLSSSGLHFLFPHLSTRLRIASGAEIRRKITVAFIVNAGLITAIALPLIILGNHLFPKWIGPAFAQEPPGIFCTIVWSFAFLGLNVTAHYALLAMGRVRIVTYLNLLAGVVMLLTMAILIPRYGLQGAALARILYGPITCIAYLYLHRTISRWEPQIVVPRAPIYKMAATGTD